MQKCNPFELSVVSSKEIRVFWVSGYLGIASYFTLAIADSEHEEPKESLLPERNLLSVSPVSVVCFPGSPLVAVDVSLPLSYCPSLCLSCSSSSGFSLAIGFSWMVSNYWVTS